VQEPNVYVWGDWVPPAEARRVAGLLNRAADIADGNEP
jgi:hypothetical protein